MSILRQKIQVANDPHRIRPNWFGLDCYPLRQIHKGLLVRHLLKGIVRVLEDRKIFFYFKLLIMLNLVWVLVDCGRFCFLVEY